MERKTLKLRFRKVNRDIFDAIWDGRKIVETRAATERYRKIKKGDCVVLVCGKDKFEKQVTASCIFKNVAALLKKYKIGQINPNMKTEDELRKLWYSFPGYKEKISKHGLIAMELK